MNRFLLVALVGIALLFLALVLSFIAMRGEPIPIERNLAFEFRPGEEEKIDVWAFTGAFSRNVTIVVVTNCTPLKLVIIEGSGKGKVVKEEEVYSHAVLKGLEELVSPRIILESNMYCSANVTLKYIYLKATYAWLSVPALIAMVMGGALLLVGGSGYLAFKLRGFSK